MARPAKEGLDYFPLDVDMHEDDKLIVVLGKFGIQGYGVIIRLLSEIYKNSYFYNWSIKEQYVFSNRINVDINLINDVVNECVEWGFFDKNTYDVHRVLTSQGIQRRYLEAAKRRKFITFIDEYFLLDPEAAKEWVNSPIRVVNVNGNEINVYRNSNSVDATHTVIPQSKVKESKVKNKEKNKDQKTLSRQPKTYAEDSAPYRMAIYLFGKIMGYAESLGKAHLVKGADMQKWAEECRKILEIDKREKEEVRQVIDWATSDSFWQQNILSPKKLREKYSDLCLKMTYSQNNAAGSRGSHAQAPDRTRSGKPMSKAIETPEGLPGLSDDELEEAKRLAAKLDSNTTKVR